MPDSTIVRPATRDNIYEVRSIAHAYGNLGYWPRRPDYLDHEMESGRLLVAEDGGGGGMLAFAAMLERRGGGAPGGAVRPAGPTGQGYRRQTPDRGHGRHRGARHVRQL